jgi:translation initiation factor IF-1
MSQPAPPNREMDGSADAGVRRDRAFRQATGVPNSTLNLSEMLIVDRDITDSLVGRLSWPVRARFWWFRAGAAAALAKPKDDTIPVEGLGRTASQRYFAASSKTGTKLAHISGKMRMHYIRILPGDRVQVELTTTSPEAASPTGTSSPAQPSAAATPNNPRDRFR